MAKLGKRKGAPESGKTLRFWGQSFSETGKKGTIQGYSLNASWLENGADDGASDSRYPVSAEFRELKIPEGSTSVAVGSLIFYLGGMGERRPLDDVIVYDTSNFALSGLRPMLCARVEPRASVMEGRIIVFGGNGDYFAEPWMEAFDLCTQEWTPLASPPFRPTCQLFMCSFLHDSSEILVDSGWHHEGVDGGDSAKDGGGEAADDDDEETGDSKSRGGRFLIYRIKQNAWAMFHSQGLESGSPFLEFDVCQHEALAVGKTLYWFTDVLIAYDLARKLWYTGPVEGMEEQGNQRSVTTSSHTPRLFHVEDDLFCLVWLDCCKHLTGPSYLQRLLCTKFQVSGKRYFPFIDQGFLSASALSFRRYHVHPLTLLGGFVLMLPLLTSSGDGQGGSSIATGQSDDELSTNYGGLDFEALSRLDGRRWSSSCRSQEGLELVDVNRDGEEESMTESIRTLSQKYRPMFFEELIGQNIVVQSLMNVILRGRVASLYLFQGPRGTGKTSTARVLAAALNCLASNKTKPCGVCRECSEFILGNVLRQLPDGCHCRVLATACEAEDFSGVVDLEEMMGVLSVLSFFSSLAKKLEFTF
ncbi:hypothetical protein RJ640_014764 [Escallonia rubra]|uniref:Uncharacterized protein n=1 Tax=Escallonia rubra TaxID=112253 RepID=A0AA88RPF8_9ASTE|nr:hypothetical protein RJ640_014764 [Escallonia rubra]